MELILELLQVEEAVKAKIKTAQNPKAKDTPVTKVPEPKKEPTKKVVDAKNKKEATFKVDGQSGKLVDKSFAPMTKFCKGDKVRISTGADECYGAHVGKTGTVVDSGYCKVNKDAYYTLKVGGKKVETVYERDLAAE